MKETENHIKNNDLDATISHELKHWKEITKSYQQANNLKALRELLFTVVPFAFLWYLMYICFDDYLWLTLLLGVINSFFVVRAFVIQHDCGHQSFFSSKWLNNTVGKLMSLISSVLYSYWAKSHQFHHGHNGQLEMPDREVSDIPTKTVREYLALSKWGKLGYRIFRNPLVTFVIAPLYYIVWASRWPGYIRSVFNKSQKIKLFWKWFLDNLLLFLSYLTAIYVTDGKFFYIHGYLVGLFIIIAFWFFYVQHQFEEGYKRWRKNWSFLASAIRGSSYYKLPRALQWLTGNIGIHHIHHLSSLIPFYNLKKCMNENKILSKYVTTITFWQSLKLTKLKLWDEDSGRMVSFKEAKKITPRLRKVS